MAVQWLEKNQTDIKSNQWAETIYGVKATNVFGLAWNYYTAYTKFITGLDITLDLGGKCEFIFGATIKIGCAQELTSWGDVRTGLIKKKVEIADKAQTLVASSEEVIETRTSSVEEENLDYEFRNAEVDFDDLEGISSSEKWTTGKLFDAPTFGVESDLQATLSSGSSLVEVTPGGVTINTTLLDLC